MPHIIFNKMADAVGDPFVILTDEQISELLEDSGFIEVLYKTNNECFTFVQWKE